MLRPSVVHIITGLGRGGAEAMLFNLLRNDSPHRTSVISLMDDGVYGPPLRALGIEVTTLDLQNKYRRFTAIPRLIRTLRRADPDIIQGWLPHGNLATLIRYLPGLPKAKVFWNVRQSDPLLQLDTSMTARLIKVGASLSKIPQNIIYNSRSGAAQHEALGYDSSRSVIIPNGFDTILFKADSRAKQRFFSDHSLPPDAIVVGLFARYHPIKNHAAFLEAAGEISRQNKNVYFVMAGTNVDGENLALRMDIQRFALADRVIMLSEVGNLHTIMPAVDICVLCSLSEGFPNIIGEAMACEVPCVVTDVGDSGFLVAETGLVVPPGSRDALVAALSTMVNFTPKQRQVLGQAARQRIIKEFSLEKIVGQYRDLYTSPFNEI